MLLQKLEKKQLIHPPKWLGTNCCYLTIMGSVAYGVSSDTSDNDIYGFAIPPREMVFPHLTGEIPGFGRQKKSFEQWSEHHIKDVDTGKDYDFAVYSIVKYMSLCMENNPNMVDSLFTPVNCVLHSTTIGNMVRENRKMFLHKGSWPKFKGYAYSQLHKMNIKNPEEGSKRAGYIEEFGYDVKFAYHVVRLLDEVKQILTLQDLDLQRNREQLKSIRRGEWKEEDIRAFFASEEKNLEEIYAKSNLPWGPDEDKIKQLLLDCLTIHYGDLTKTGFVVPGRAEQTLKSIYEMCEKYFQKE